ncbi:mast cell protease 2-like [Astatotilapia calliptera]|uniref:mast cell protease 2-like n=1 Tax=Astatotilapia calliptera TaxID=8154 RepID=UPI000E408E81|nr:mast cell protease 2-like [Astatotilapia calliptera]
MCQMCQYGLQKNLLLHLLACLGKARNIIHGEKAPKNLMQYMASVQNNKGEHVCGGFLIKEDFAVSAAHCDKYNLTYVVLGNHNLKNSSHQKIRIENKTIHENYKGVGHHDDVVCLQLSKKAHLGHGVQTIKFQPAEINLKENQVCQVAGWGKTETDDDKPADELMVVDVDVSVREAVLENLFTLTEKYPFRKIGRKPE